MGLMASARQAQVLQSDIRTMSIACGRVGGINLSQGVCDTPVPEAVLRGAHKVRPIRLSCRIVKKKGVPRTL